MSAADLDLSLPMAELIRSALSSTHSSIGSSDGARWLIRGKLDRDEYIRFLIILYHVYEDLEQALQQHASNPVLSPSYNPALLSRLSALRADIAYLLSVPEPEVSAHALFKSVASSPPPALVAYTARIRALRDSSDPKPLLAHAYVRYMGDLSGGQILRRSAMRSYDLGDEGNGTSAYIFSKLEGGGRADANEIARIKDWFRDGMNAGVGGDRELKAAIVAEARRVYDFNAGLFRCIKPPSSATNLKDAATDHSMHLAKSGSSQYVMGSLYQTQGVIAFVVALCLVVLVGGFTRELGWSNHASLIGWISAMRSEALN